MSNIKGWLVDQVKLISMLMLTIWESRLKIDLHEAAIIVRSIVKSFRISSSSEPEFSTIIRIQIYHSGV